MSWQSTFRKLEAAQRRVDRESIRWQKELARRQKEQDKLTAMEQAILEVEAYENRLDVLTSLHAESSAQMDWCVFAYSLPPPPPTDFGHHSCRVRLELAVKPQSVWTTEEQERLREAEILDRLTHDRALKERQEEVLACGKMRHLAQRVLEGDPHAYAEAIVELSPLAELANLGSELAVNVLTHDVLECEMVVNGTEIIPKEVKSLTASSKLSVKPMPKNRFHEIYQDYVCSCVLRAARELLALLPTDCIIVTAKVHQKSLVTGHGEDVPVLSIAATRAVMGDLEFGEIDPSDAMDNFLHRGDAKASKRAEVFSPIEPLQLADVIRDERQQLPTLELLRKVSSLREEIRCQLPTANSANSPCPITS
jgi:hypothetical protein